MEQMLEFMAENYIWIIIIGIVVMMTIIGYIADKTDFGKQSMKKSKKEKVVKNEVEDDVEEMVDIVEPVAYTEEIQPMSTEESYNEEENVVPAFDTDEMFNLNESAVNVEYPEEQVELQQEIVEDDAEEMDKKTLKRMQKEEAKRLKEEAKKLKEEEKRLKKESKNENIEEIAQEPEMENFYAEEPVQVNEVTETSSDLFEPMEDIAIDVPNTELDIEMPAEEMNAEPEMKNFYEKESIPVSNEVEESNEVIDEIPEIELPSIESLDKELTDYEEEDDVWKF